MANTKRKPAGAATPDLAALISAVLNHPEVPVVIYNGLSDAVTELFNGITRADQDKLSNSVEYIGVVLRAHGKQRRAR